MNGSPLTLFASSVFWRGGGGLSANNNIMGGDSARRVGRGGACCRMMYASRWGRPNVPPRVGWVGGGERAISRDDGAATIPSVVSLSPGIIRTRRTIRHDAVPGGRRALPVVCGVGISTAIGRRRSFDVDIDP